MSGTQCPQCGRIFSDNYNLQRHFDGYNPPCGKRQFTPLTNADIAKQMSKYPALNI